MKSTLPWLLWLSFSMMMLLITRNPIYLGICFLTFLIVGFTESKKKQQEFWLRNILRFVLMMIVLSTLINALFTHVGETRLFSFPENWLLIGGAITLESLVYGAINGLIISAIFLVFNIVNMALSAKQLTRLIPAIFQPSTMVVTIALTFFPSIQQRYREIKEAQMIRGNPMGKISDWLPLIIPLLISSLENVILLSESLTSRGYQSKQSPRTSKLILIGLILVVFGVFSGWILHLYDYPELYTMILYLVSISIMLLVFIIGGKQIKVTHYHDDTWDSNAILLTFLYSCAIIGSIILRILHFLPSLTYIPYPSISIPGIQLAALTLCLIPLSQVLLKSNDSNH